MNIKKILDEENATFPAPTSKDPWGFETRGLLSFVAKCFELAGITDAEIDLNMIAHANQDLATFMHYREIAATEPYRRRLDRENKIKVENSKLRKLLSKFESGKVDAMMLDKRRSITAEVDNRLAKAVAAELRRVADEYE